MQFRLHCRGRSMALALVCQLLTLAGNTVCAAEPGASAVDPFDALPVVVASDDVQTAPPAPPVERKAESAELVRSTLESFAASMVFDPDVARLDQAFPFDADVPLPVGTPAGRPTTDPRPGRTGTGDTAAGVPRGRRPTASP